MFFLLSFTVAFPAPPQIWKTMPRSHHIPTPRLFIFYLFLSISLAMSPKSIDYTLGGPFHTHFPVALQIYYTFED